MDKVLDNRALVLWVQVLGNDSINLERPVKVLCVKVENRQVCLFFSKVPLEIEGCAPEWCSTCGCSTFEL